MTDMTGDDAFRILLEELRSTDEKNGRLLNEKSGLETSLDAARTEIDEIAKRLVRAEERLKVNEKPLVELYDAAEAVTTFIGRDYAPHELTNFIERLKAALKPAEVACGKLPF